MRQRMLMKYHKLDWIKLDQYTFHTYDFVNLGILVPANTSTYHAWVRVNYDATNHLNTGTANAADMQVTIGGDKIKFYSTSILDINGASYNASTTTTNNDCIGKIYIEIHQSNTLSNCKINWTTRTATGANDNYLYTYNESTVGIHWNMVDQPVVIGTPTGETLQGPVISIEYNTGGSTITLYPYTNVKDGYTYFCNEDMTVVLPTVKQLDWVETVGTDNCKYVTDFTWPETLYWQVLCSFYYPSCPSWGFIYSSKFNAVAWNKDTGDGKPRAYGIRRLNSSDTTRIIEHQNLGTSLTTGTNIVSNTHTKASQGYGTYYKGAYGLSAPSDSYKIGTMFARVQYRNWGASANWTRFASNYNESADFGTTTLTIFTGWVGEAHAPAGTRFYGLLIYTSTNSSSTPSATDYVKLGFTLIPCRVIDEYGLYDIKSGTLYHHEGGGNVLFSDGHIESSTS